MTAAAMLEGITVEGGWLVTKQIDLSSTTGGCHSYCYECEREGKKAFLKALDYSRAFSDGADTPKELAKLTAAFNHERDVLDVCAQRRMSHVAIAITYGTVQVPNLGQMEGRVSYLIFDAAKGDVRTQISNSHRQDDYWLMGIVLDVTKGLWQVHREMIAHQDLKPSNTLVYSDNRSKLADFGRSSRKGRPIGHDEYIVAGDHTYAPFEQLYGYNDPDFVKRRFGCDMYLLGNLICFLFCGVNVTAKVLEKLDETIHPTKWGGSYADVIPYMQHAFSEFLVEIRRSLSTSVASEVIDLIRELCNPDLSQRGFPKSIGRHDQYSLERYVSRINLQCSRLQIGRVTRLAS